MTEKFKLNLCQGAPRDEYTADREYWKWNQNLKEIPNDIPADALKVDIAFNDITTVRANVFAHLTQCKILHLGTNGISEIEPGAFNGLIALTNFEIWRSELERLFANMFSNLKNCRHMRIQLSRITEVEPGSFNGLTSLRHLYLSRNDRLNILRAGMFHGLIAIHTLWVSHNGINTIDDGTFANLKTLEVLFMNQNDLETLRLGIFFGLVSLKNLYLDRNRLTTLSADVFRHLSRPLKLTLHNKVANLTTDNPLKCDVRLCWLKQEELQGNITWSYYDTDSSPDRPFKPRCTDGIDWETFTCLEKGDVSQSHNFSGLFVNYIQFL